MKFLKGFFVFILILIIVSGVGYIGYNLIFGNSNFMGQDVAVNTQTQQPDGSNANSVQNQQGMQHGSTNDQASQNNSQQPEMNRIAVNQSNTILQSKEKLNKAAALINESLRLMSVDPYAPGSDNARDMSSMDSAKSDPQTDSVPVQDGIPTESTSTNNTTINIFPQGNGSGLQADAMPQNSIMQNMGTTYDANKMEQLHSGLYKIAVGKALLEQLGSELDYQAEYAVMNIQDPVQYYSNQYNLIVQNKNKLNQAITYINEAANLVNINPYVSSSGLIYDKDRMNQIHQSILKLAEGVASLNQLGDDFSKQSIALSTGVQNYINNANVIVSTQTNHTTTTSPGLFGGLFNNISIATVINVILIIFVIGLIFGIFGFIFSFLKSPNQKNSKENNGTL